MEHVALLSIISKFLDTFNASEISPQWDKLNERMNSEFYQPGGTQLSSALHGHFVDLYGAFMLVIRNLTLLDKEKKFPQDYKKGDDACDEYVEAHNNLLLLDKKYQSKKWWIENAMAHKTKFKTDQKNWLDELAKKRISEEEEQLDAAKNRKAVAEASVQLVLAFQQFSTAPV